MPAQEWEFREPTLLEALEAIIGPIPSRPMLPAERAAHEGAFEVEGPDAYLSADEMAALDERAEAWVSELYGPERAA